MNNADPKSAAGRYAVAKKLFAILAEHSAEEIETAADVVRGNEALAEVLHQLATVRGQEESPLSSTVAGVNEARQAEGPPAEPDDPWPLRRPSYLTEADMLDMLRTAMADPAVPREELLKLPRQWGANAARRLESEKGRPALVLALDTLFEKRFASPSDRIVAGFETLYRLAKHTGLQDRVLRRLRHDVEARLVDNTLTYPTLHSIAGLRQKWGKIPPLLAPHESRSDVARNLVNDLLRKYGEGMDEQVNALLILMHDVARDAMDPLIARRRRAQAKERQDDED